MKAKRTFSHDTLPSSRVQGGPPDSAGQASGQLPAHARDPADPGLPAVAAGLRSLRVRELAREAEQKLVMNGVTGIKNTSQTSFYSLI